jgi:hypothetical protein
LRVANAKIKISVMCFIIQNNLSENQSRGYAESVNRGFTKPNVKTGTLISRKKSQQKSGDERSPLFCF